MTLEWCSSPEMVTLTSKMGRKENSKDTSRSEVVDAKDVGVRVVSLLVNSLEKQHIIKIESPNLQSHDYKLVGVANWNQ